MDEPPRPAELSEQAWQATPLEVRLFLALLMEQIAALEARLNQTSQNSSKPPSSDPPSAPSAQTKTPRGKPKPKGAQPRHPDQQRELLPEAEVDQVVPVHPTCCPHCHDMLPATLRPVGLPERQQVWKLPEVRPLVIEYQYLTVCCPGCGTLATGTRPVDVPPGAFCPRVVALIALLHGRYGISNRELIILLQMVWQLPISVGSVAHLQQVASCQSSPYTAHMSSAMLHNRRQSCTAAEIVGNAAHLSRSSAIVHNLPTSRLSLQYPARSTRVVAGRSYGRETCSCARST